MKKTLKAVNSLLFVGFLCFMLYMLLNYQTVNFSKILITLCILPLIMVPFLLDKIKVYHMDCFLIFFYYIYLLVALVLGSLLGYYYKIWWLDLLAHFLSGIVSSIVAFILLEKNKLVSKKYRFFGFLFILAFSICVAGCWEYFEFCSDKLLHGDVQWVAKTGVDDTMTDMLIATLAGLLSSIYYLYYLHKKK